MEGQGKPRLYKPKKPRLDLLAEQGGGSGFLVKRLFLPLVMAEFGNQTVMDFCIVRKFTFKHKNRRPARKAKGRSHHEWCFLCFFFIWNEVVVPCANRYAKPNDYYFGEIIFGIKKILYICSGKYKQRYDDETRKGETAEAEAE